MSDDNEDLYAELDRIARRLSDMSVRVTEFEARLARVEAEQPQEVAL